MKKDIFALLAIAALASGSFFMLHKQALAEHEGHAGHAAQTAQDAPAAKPDMIYNCTNDAFKLLQDGNQYTLQAQIETPSLGYTYEVSEISAKHGRIKAVVKLTAPEGVAAQVIRSIEITHTFTHEGMLHQLDLSLEKSFNWGADSVTCTHD